MGPSCPTRRAAGTDGNGIDKLVLPRWLCDAFTITRHNVTPVPLGALALLSVIS